MRALARYIPNTNMDFGCSSSSFSVWAKLMIVLSVLVAANASSENAKTVEFNVKPGGVVHSFSEKIVSKLCLQRNYKNCSVELYRIVHVNI